MLNNTEIVHRIQKIMNENELSASSFADRIGVQRSSISHILSGRNKPSLDFLAKIEDNFEEVSFSWLLKGDGKGNFLPISINESGFFTPNDVKDMKTIKVGNKEVILVANNDDLLQAIEFKSPVAGI